MNTKKFIHLHVSQLRLDDVSGLTSGTVELAMDKSACLDKLSFVKLQALKTNNDIFNSLINKKQGSMLTSAIKAENKKRYKLFSEIKLTSKTASISSLPAIAAAGTKLTETLNPFGNINKESIINRTTQINIFEERYSADTEAVAAVTTLGLTPVVTALFASNTALANLYNSRLDEIAAAAGPSASSVKADVVKAYNSFCESVQLTLSALPTEPLQLLFNELNDLRRKYIAHLPTPLRDAHTSVEPIPVQVYTGAPVTPLPKVYFNADKETVELQFSKDYYVTYRNNTEAGEAKLFVHGTGKYTGKYGTAFHIARV